jgi:hypothetical protein
MLALVIWFCSLSSSRRFVTMLAAFRQYLRTFLTMRRMASALISAKCLARYASEFHSMKASFAELPSLVTCKSLAFSVTLGRGDPAAGMEKDFGASMDPRGRTSVESADDATFLNFAADRGVGGEQGAASKRLLAARRDRLLT